MAAEQQPWWANQGHQRALAMRSARLAKSRRSWSLVGCLLLWVLMWIAGGTYYMSSQQSTRGAPLAGLDDFERPRDGFLAGCADDCRAFATFKLALAACKAREDCGGVTMVPFEEAARRYELRAGRSVVHSTDGQLSFVKRQPVAPLHGLSDKVLSDGPLAADAAQAAPQAAPQAAAQAVPEAGANEILGEAETESSDVAAAATPGDVGADAAERRRLHLEDPDLFFTEDDGEGVEDGPLIIEEPEEGSDFHVTFWRPPRETPLDDIGKSIAGQPTIFIGIASYRDSMCHDTIERALKWAKFPERLRFGAVDQFIQGDTPCFETKVSCDEDPEQLLCKYRNNIRIHKVSAKKARGPTFGRHRADSLYRGETFALQVDAHMYFVRHWDVDMVDQFESTRNDYAVLSTYPTDYSRTTLNAKTGSSPWRMTPSICHSKFIGQNGMTKHEGAREFRPKIKTPVLQVWWGAGVSFSKGHRVVRVPYDGFLPMLFDGEETAMAYRMWTAGYDFYTFHHAAVFHPYSRKNKPPNFWENGKRHRAERAKDLVASENRLLKVYGLPTRSAFPDTQLERFGLGDRRPLEKFWKLFGVDYKNRQVTNNCDAAMSGALHGALVPFLRPDGRGIDYDRVDDTVNFKKAARRAARGLGEYASLS